MDNPKIHVPDEAFENLFALFERYSWNLDDTPGGNDDEINPDVLGYIFEKYINQKEFGAYYTRPEITGYLCEQTIYKLVLDKINAAIPRPPRQFASIPELLLGLDANLCRRLLHDVLPSLSLLDPACGSGAFLVAA
jgi:type I restriction-modification system DNA methylase subunit